MYDGTPILGAMVLGGITLTTVGHFWLLMAAFTLLTAIGALYRLLPKRGT